MTSMNSSWLSGSSPENGSSSTASAGRWSTAPANWTFCWLPLESVLSFALARSPRPSRSSQRIPAARVAARDMPRSSPR